MKQFLVLLLALLIFMQPFNKVWIIVSFEINKEEIAKNLCVKREVKNNTCQGQCHLKKKLDKAEEEDKKKLPSNQKEKSEILYCHILKPSNILKTIPSFVIRVKLGFKRILYLSSYTSNIFHPPKLNMIQ